MMALVDRNGREVTPQTKAMADAGITPITQRQFEKHLKQNATVAETHEIARAYAADALDHFARQVPELVARMIVDFMTVQGFIVKPAPDTIATAVSENTAVDTAPTDSIPPVTDGAINGKEMGET